MTDRQVLSAIRDIENDCKDKEGVVNKVTFYERIKGLVVLLDNSMPRPKGGSGTVG